MSVEEQVESLLAPVVATLDIELLDVEFIQGTLRLTVDGEGGVSTEQLTGVNRLVGPLLDQHDPIPGRYTLEVTSPGLERPLKRPEHYRRAVGEEIVVKMVPAVEPRRYKGRLVEVADDGATITLDALEIDGVELDEASSERLDRSEIATARTVFEWGPGPKPGGGRGANQGRKSGVKKKPGRAAEARRRPDHEVSDEQ